MSSEQPLPKQSEAQDGVRWMGGKETRGVATCATAAAAGSTPAAAAAAASRGPKRRFWGLGFRVGFRVRRC